MGRPVPLCTFSARPARSCHLDWHNQEFFGLAKQDQVSVRNQSQVGFDPGSFSEKDKELNGLYVKDVIKRFREFLFPQTDEDDDDDADERRPSKKQKGG
jgi:hypothetical protein